MNHTEYESIEALQGWPIIDVAELVDKSDRTLLYGYTVERHTHHVYLKDQFIHVLIYVSNFDMSDEKIKDVVFYNVDKRHHLKRIPFLPNKRLYPERCDFDFCKVLIEKGLELSFTNYIANNQFMRPTGFYGLIYEEKE